MKLEDDLRKAVIRQSYVEVQTLAAELGVQAAAEWRAFPPGDPRRRHVFDHLQIMLEWARRMVCVSRASAAEELRRTLLCRRYRRPSNSTGTRLDLDL